MSFLCEAWLGLTRSDLILNPDKEISESEILKFLYGIKDLKKNRQFNMASHFDSFWFKDGKEGNIPRPETEELVDWIVTSNSNKNAKILLILEQEVDVLD